MGGKMRDCSEFFQDGKTLTNCSKMFILNHICIGWGPSNRFVGALPFETDVSGREQMQL